jgi:hypothetical protein
VRGLLNPRTQYLLFLDESGTHDMRTVDPHWPVFVLLGLLEGEIYYQKTLVPRVKELKARYQINKTSPLHSRHIRRWDGAFSFLREQKKRGSFYEDINQLFKQCRIRIFAIIIDKIRFSKRFLFAPNPYDVSLNQLLSLICGPPGIPGPNRPFVQRIIAEARGKAEDRALQKEYSSFARSGLSAYGARHVQSRLPRTVKRLFPSHIDFAHKSAAVAGLELADLAAYPIGRAFINGDWKNPAYLAVASRIRGHIVFP